MLKNRLSDHMTNNETCHSHRPNVIPAPGEALVVANKVVVDLTPEKTTTTVASNFITSDDHSGVVDHKIIDHNETVIDVPDPPTNSVSEVIEYNDPELSDF